MPIIQSHFSNHFILLFVELTIGSTGVEAQFGIVGVRSLKKIKWEVYDFAFKRFIDKKYFLACVLYRRSHYFGLFSYHSQFELP